MLKVIEDLKTRGIVNQVTSDEKQQKMPHDSGVYIGFDPTAQSLHLGNYTQIAILLRFKKAGYRTIAILGGATGMIGDPSFRNSERDFLDQKTLKINKDKIRKQLESFGLEVIDNKDFYDHKNVLEFLREVGKYINISSMLTKESVATRIKLGLSYTEFSYALLQAYDFLTLYQNYNVFLQIGGSDQWGNIVTGIQLIEKKLGKENLAWGLTAKLLTDENGEKFGKSKGGGALWLDKDMTSPFALYQHLINLPDSTIEANLKWMTFLSLEEITKIMHEHKEKPFLRYAQKRLAQEIIQDIHGEEEFFISLKISKFLYGKRTREIIQLTKDELKIVQQVLPSFKFQESLGNSLIKAKIVKSKRELREFYQSHAIEVNYHKISSDEDELNWSLYENILLVKLGKKFYCFYK